MKHPRWLVTVCLAALAGCARLPEPAPPPAQKARATGQPAHYALMRERSADERIMEGIDREIYDDWRWAGRRAVLRFSVDETRGVQFEVVLVIPHEFVRAGGRKIDVRIGGRLLGSIKAEQAGYQAWKQPVPEEWLAPGRDITVELLADAEWLQGNEKRGYMLNGAGFTL